MRAAHDWTTAAPAARDKRPAAAERAHLRLDPAGLIALQRTVGNAATGALLARVRVLARRPDEAKIRARAYELWERRGGGVRSREEDEANYFEALRQVEIEERAHAIAQQRSGHDPVANYYEAERQFKLDELGKRLATLSSTLDHTVQAHFQDSIEHAKRAKPGTSEATSLMIYAEEAVSRLSSLQSRGQLNATTVKVGKKRTIVVKPVYVTTTTFPQPASPSVWQSQFEDCRRVWAGLGVSFQEEGSGDVRLDDSTEAGHLLSNDGALRSGTKLTKGAAMGRFDELMDPYKPAGNVLPVFILPTKLAAEQTDGTTINARTVYIAGNRASVNVLAHEMSHVLGIDHPKYEEGDYHTHPGEKGSVADPSGGQGFASTIGHAGKTNPLSHYDLMETYETTEKQRRVQQLLEEARLDLKFSQEQVMAVIARDSTNASEVQGDFSKLQWRSQSAGANAVGLYNELQRIHARIGLLKAGKVQPEELGLTFPVRVMVENRPVVIFGHD
jgi:hypothetical protein